MSFMNKPSLDQRLEARQRPINSFSIMKQKWRNLLFLHWAIEPHLVQSTLPKGLTVDIFKDKAYIGISPFWLEDVRPRFFPPVPGISNFFEINVRTYVHDETGLPGVWFYSLDANQFLAVTLARIFYGLPYRYCEINSF